MLSTGSLTRYALPGGYGLLAGAVYKMVYGWAWHQSAAEIILAARADPITTIGGAVIIGFAINETLYQQLAAPCIRCGITIRLPRWTPASRRGCDAYEITLGTFYAADLGGAVLGNLLDLTAFRQALAHAHGIDASDLAGTPPPPGATSTLRNAYTARLRRHRAALHAFIRLAAATGEPEIHRNYANKAAIYHALGASRATLCAISAAALIDIVARHRHAFAVHLVCSIEATGVLALALCLTWRMMQANQRSRWMVLLDELSHDLRSWALRHPQELSALAGR